MSVSHAIYHGRSNHMAHSIYCLRSLAFSGALNAVYPCTGDEIRIGPYRLAYTGTELKPYDESTHYKRKDVKA